MTWLRTIAAVSALLLMLPSSVAAFGTCVYIDPELRAVFDGRVVLKLANGQKSKVAGRWEAVQEGFACVSSPAPWHLEHETRGRLVSLARRVEVVNGNIREFSEFRALLDAMVAPALSLLLGRLGVPFDAQATIKDVRGSVDEVEGDASKRKLKGHLDVVYYRMGRKKRAKLKFRLNGELVPELR